MPDFIQQLDERVLVWIAEHVRCGLLDPFMMLYTQLGNTGMLFIVLGIALLFFKQTRKAGFSALCAMLIGLIVVEHDPNSFPSGHTNAAFAFAVAVCMSAPKKWMKITAVCMAAVMGLSRLYVGVHFPSDVLAGAAIGSLCGLAGAWVVKKVWGRVSARLPKAPE